VHACKDGAVPERLLPFLAVVGVLTILPGPDMALVTRNGVRGGRRGAWYTGMGTAVGLIVWAATSVLGLAAALAASGHAFDVLRLVGAVYLFVLGLGALRAALSGQAGDGSRMRLSPGVDPALGARVAALRRIWFRQGLISNLLNPKIALLFLTLLPQFVAPGEPRGATTAELGLTIVVVDVVWWSTFSLAVGAIGRALSSSRVRRTIEGLAGTVLVGLALRVAVNR
jgi:threonine/homoserine/homoserine lactone efflux protein